MTSIVIIDYEVGNIRSIIAAFQKMGIRPKLTHDKNEIMAASGIVLPGVGSYSYAMEKLRKFSVDGAIKDFAASGKPILGICLGMQLLLSGSNEFGYTEGLDLIKGSVINLRNLDASIKKLPHVGWSKLESLDQSNWHNTVLDSISLGSHMYFLHSFVAIPNDANHILSLTAYFDSKFCSAVCSENIFGCQFHPEKSGEPGLRIIDNFIKICEV